MHKIREVKQSKFQIITGHLLAEKQFLLENPMFLWVKQPTVKREHQTDWHVLGANSNYNVTTQPPVIGNYGFSKGGKLA